MSESEITILIVDDDPDLRAVHTLHLSSLGYDVIEAGSSKEALNAIQQGPEQVSAILADIVMPEMNGYDLCKAIKDDPETQDIPLIFVSKLATLDEKVKGFSVGADDYISKPISPEELGFKIRALLELSQKNKALKQQLSETQSVAMQAMTYSSDMGRIVEFFKNTLSAEDFEDIAELLFEVTDAYDLGCSLQFVMLDKYINFGHRGEASPLESDIIELWRNKGRFVDFGPKTVINYDNFSLLIKNMPLDDPERYGMLKDLLGTLCNAIEARVKFLLYQKLVNRKEELVDAVIKLMADVDKAALSAQGSGRAVTSKMIGRLDDAIGNLDIVEEDKNSLRNIAADCRDSSLGAYDQVIGLYDKFEVIRQQLDGLLEAENSEKIAS